MAYLMIVDDDQDFANAAARVLRDAGHEVDIALDIQTGIDRMQARRPDLAILDVMFPESDSAGFDLARTIRHGMADLEGIPVLMLTAVNVRYPLGFSAKDIDEQWLPVADFLEKPMDLGLLNSKVSAVLEKVAAASGGEEGT